MANIGTLLKGEIERLARKEIRKEAAKLKKASAQFRRDLAAIKRQLADAVRGGKKSAAPAAVPAAAGDGAQFRFTVKGLKSQRKRLGLSASDYGKLIGVSGQSIYKWEREEARPRAKQIARLAAIRSMGKKEAQARLSPQ